MDTIQIPVNSTFEEAYMNVNVMYVRKHVHTHTLTRGNLEQIIML